MEIKRATKGLVGKQKMSFWENSTHGKMLYTMIIQHIVWCSSSTWSWMSEDVEDITRKWTRKKEKEERERQKRRERERGGEHSLFVWCSMYACGCFFLIFLRVRACFFMWWGYLVEGTMKWSLLHCNRNFIKINEYSRAFTIQQGKKYPQQGTLNKVPSPR